MQILNNKSVAILIAIFLMSSMLASTLLVPNTSAHQPAWQIPTYAYVTANPSPVGVNQQVLVVMWLDKLIDPTTAIINDWRFHNYNLTIVAPDNTVSTTIFVNVTDTTSSQTTTFTPTQVGTYKIYFNFPGQNYNDYSHNPASTLVNDTFLASSATTTLIVQQQPLPGPIGSYPLPADYWTRPIYGENTDWYSISSNWLGSGAPPISSFGSGIAGSGGIGAFTGSAQLNRYPGDAVGSQTAHIMWTKPLQQGGVAGGNVFPVPANTFFEGSAYNQRYTNPIIMDGILYYTEPVSFTGTTSGPTDAVDLRTGQVLWSRTDVPALSFGYIYDLEDPNQHGVFPPILFTSGYARAFDAYTGDPLFNVTGVPSGMEALGPQGEHLRYVIANAGSASSPDYRIGEWNSSKIWTYTLNPFTNASLLSPTVYNMSTIVSFGVAQSPAIPVPGNQFNGNNSNAYIVDGSISNPANPLSRYDWNYSIPLYNTLTANQLGNTSVLAVFPNNMMLLRVGAYPVLADASTTAGVSATNNAISFTTPYTYYGINLNASKGTIGTTLWSNTLNAPPGNVTVTFGGADPTVGVFVEGTKETMQWTGYSLANGAKLWGPVGNQSPWDYYGNPIYDYASGQVAYGKLYSSGYGGIIYTYDLKTGNLLWTYGDGGLGNSTRSGFYTPYGGYPTFINAVGGGVLYLVTTEHTIETPVYKGALERAINATDGTEIWQLSGYTGEFSAMSYGIADGFATWFNGIDNQIYIVGRGSSATTVNAPNAALAFGTPVVITGTVTDTSSGTKQNAPAADFPHGVPVSSDASMKDWMGYVYQQKPIPTNFTGVQVTIGVIDSNNNTRAIGTATTDASGMFSLTWTPNIEGNYTVFANFPGTNGYWPSYAESAFNVMPTAAASPTQVPTSSSASMTNTYVLASAIAIIIVIIIIGALILMMLRKRA